MKTIILSIITLFVFSKIPQLKPNTSEIMYIGIENVIPITLNGCNPEDISVKVTSGIIYKKDDSTFAFNPQIETEEFKIKLYFKKVICESKTIIVRKQPEPTVTMVGENNGMILLSDLISNGNLTLKYPENFPPHLRSAISSFHLTIREPSGIGIFSAMMRNDKIDEGTINFLKTVKKGSAVVINNITTYSPISGQIRLNMTKEITIK